MKKFSLILLILPLLWSCKTDTTNPIAEPIIEAPIDSPAAPQEVDILSDQIATAHLLLKPALFKMKLENSPGITLLDVRTPAELVANGSIAGAQNYDFNAPDFQAKMEALDKKAPVMLYCKSGNRSGQAATMLKEMGFKQVYDLNGGYDSWLANGF
jgi:rhodanese-related sulfurtransferase